MNYKSIQITPKRIIFISLIGIVLILLVIKASWSSDEGIEVYNKSQIDPLIKSIDMDRIEQELNGDKYNVTKQGKEKIKEFVIEVNKWRKDVKIKITELRNAISILQKNVANNTASVEREQTALNSYNNKFKNSNFQQTGIIRVQISGASKRLSLFKQTLSRSQTALDSKIIEYNTMVDSILKKSQDEKNQADKIILDYKKPEGYVEPSIVKNQATISQSSVPAPATEATLNKTNQLNYSIQDAAPTYPDYKYKGCWSSGNDTQYPILTKMVVSNIFNMDDCVGKISQAGLKSVAYDGKNICTGGGEEYSEYTHAKCDSTHSQGKSWLVYSKNT
jgi:hypothetical protein